jgi:hypothetical protein
MEGVKDKRGHERRDAVAGWRIQEELSGGGRILLDLFAMLWNRSYFYGTPVPVPTFEKLQFRWLRQVTVPVPVPIPVPVSAPYLDLKNKFFWKKSEKILPFYILIFFTRKSL